MNLNFKFLAVIRCAAIGLVLFALPISVLAQEEIPIDLTPSISSDLFYGALKSTYLKNPSLNAARAELRSVNETLDQAYSGFRPNIYGEGEIQYLDTEEDGSFFIDSGGDNTSKTGSLNVEQNLFRGGKTFAEVRAARNFIASQRYNVFALEQQTLLSAVTAYMDVLRDRAVINLNEKNLEVVSKQLQQSRDRYEVGEISQTGVSQSEARVADANALLIRAKGNLRASQSVYEQVIQQDVPGDLEFPDVVFDLPNSLDQALTIANDNNPLIQSAEYFHAFSEDDVDSVFAELLPQIGLAGALTRTFDPQPGFFDETRNKSVAISATIPLYQSGATRSRVRQAKEVANQRFIEILDARTQVRQETVANWEEWYTSKAEIEARQAQVEAAADSQRTLTLEAEVGERTIIDKLDADRELLDAEVALVTAQRNEIVAHYALASSLGYLSPIQLGFEDVAVDYEAELQGQSPRRLQELINIDED